MPERRHTVVIVTPTPATADGGNQQTAQRFARILQARYRVHIGHQWAGDEGGDLMIALHARRSATSVAAWAQQSPRRPLLLVMTGTDLYQDIHTDPAAQASLASADRLYLLNERGALALPPPLRGRAFVGLQSCSARQPACKPQRHLRALMVGHLRAVKSPETFFAAARLLHDRPDIYLDHIGAALEPGLDAAAQALMLACPRYRWLGPLPAASTRRRIQAAHVLVHPSRLEGGAHVVMEALCSGTAVLASRVDGNTGLLGEQHPGLFDWGDAAALAQLLRQARDDAAMLAHLTEAGALRAPLFHPQREAQRLLGLIAGLLHTGAPHAHT